MAGFLRGDSSNRGVLKSEQQSSSHDQLEEHDNFRPSWYFSRKEIEENSPSRRDGIDLKKETYLRKSYCTFLQDLGMRLKVPQVTIATAMVFCHRFFLLQSHAKNDRRTIATVCMFLAGKVEESPRPLKDVIIVSYEIINKKDPSAVQRIKQKEVYEQQKELILLGERVVLSTIGFDLNVHHPYKPLVEAIKKFKVAQNALAQVAWNFVNDGLRTSLCLQFKSRHIAAGAVFLAAKFLKVKLPSDGEKVWWQEFDVTPRQLEDVSNQMLELYEQNRPGQPSQMNDVEGSTSVGINPVVMSATAHENVSSSSGQSRPAGLINVKQGVQAPVPAGPLGAQLSSDHQIVPRPNSRKQRTDTCSADTKSGVWDQSMENEVKPVVHDREIVTDTSSYPQSSLVRPMQEGMIDEKDEEVEARDWKVEASIPKYSSSGDHTTGKAEVAKGSYPRDAIAKIDKDRVKAAFEKQKKLRNNAVRRTNLVDDDDLIEMELEKGIELPVEDHKMTQERKHGWSKPLNSREPQDQSFETSGRVKSRSFDSNLHIGHEQEKTEEGELTSLDEHDVHSPKLGKCNDKAVNTRRQQQEQHDFPRPSGDGGDMCRTGMDRNHDDHSSAKMAREKAMSMGRLLDNKRPRDLPHQPKDSTGTGWVDNTEGDSTRQEHNNYG